MIRGRKKVPDWRERGATHLLSFPLAGDDGKTTVIPTSGTLTLYKPDGTKLIDAQATTNRLVDPKSGLLTTDTVKGVQAASYEATIPADATLGERWLQEWVLTATVGGTTQVMTFKHEMALVRQVIYPVIVESDLTEGRHRNLDDVLKDSAHDSLVDYIDEAWYVLVGNLIKNGQYPYRVLSSWAFRLYHIYSSLELLFRDACTNQPKDAGYRKQLEDYTELSKSEWKSLIATLDRDNDGLPSSTETQQIVSGSSSLATSQAERVAANINPAAAFAQPGGGGYVFSDGVVIAGGDGPSRGW